MTDAGTRIMDVMHHRKRGNSRFPENEMVDNPEARLPLDLERISPATPRTENLKRKGELYAVADSPIV